MSDGVKGFMQRWFVTTLGVLVATGLIADIDSRNMVSLLTASLLLGILNAFLRPILLILTLPLVILSLGIFALVINAVLLYGVSRVVDGFYVEGFWAAFKGAIVISIVSVFANMMFGKKRVPEETRRANPPDKPLPPADTGSGPVIDV